MKYIAHRGNLNGPNKELENQPSYLDKAIQKGYYVELDLWKIEDDLFLGHDEPQYKIDLSFLQDRKDKIYCHCKNIDALEYILTYAPEIECFFHDSDDCVLTSKGYIWTYPGKQLTKKSICVMPERVNLQLHSLNCYGVCTDFHI